jgi:hypothetical protein
MQAITLPPLVTLNWENQYRIIPSVFPPINFFEDLVDASQMEEAFYIESLTNDRIREEVGHIDLIPKEDRISGRGSSVVMAAFTHIGRASRFSDGTYGVYYASRYLRTAVKETVFHRENFLSATQEEPMNIDMRVYRGQVLKPVHDLRSAEYTALHHPENYHPSQEAGQYLRALDSWGVVYNSMRDNGGECVGAFRPPAISIPIPSKHLIYMWDGQKINHICEKSLLSIV